MKKFLGMLFLLLVIGIPVFIYTSSMFERVPPKIEIQHKDYWNLKKDTLFIHISDESGIKFYKIVLINDGKAKILAKKEFSDKEIVKDKTIPIDIPEFYPIKGDKITLQVEVVDKSKWNYFAGNEKKVSKIIKLDTISPSTMVISNNYSMKRGGSGIAIVSVKDKHLKTAYIKISERDEPTNYKIFKLTPFYKKDYYISLLAWPYEYKTFSADLIAIDEAGNMSTSHIPIRWGGVRYPKVNINITDAFIKRVDVSLLEKMNMSIPNDAKSIFKKVNEEVRKLNEKTLYKVTNVILEDKINNLYIKPFRPMKRASKQASYGEMRSYIYNGEKISFAIHKGLDLASFRHARIYASNKGKVLYKNFTGIYGNTLALYHKLGLVSTYSHCSKIDVGDNVQRGSVIARTGRTGAVFGDHLHFGIFVQGIPVQPLEWMDRKWIKDNITDVIINSKRIINR